MNDREDLVATLVPLAEVARRLNLWESFVIALVERNMLRAYRVPGSADLFIVPDSIRDAEVGMRAVAHLRTRAQGATVDEVVGEVQKALASLVTVRDRLRQVWDPEVAEIWLDSSNAHLGGATPRQVLAERGPDEVLRAIEAEAQGAYAARGKTLEEHQFVNLLAEEALSHPERMGDMAEVLDGVDELLDGVSREPASVPLTARPLIIDARGKGEAADYMEVAAVHGGKRRDRAIWQFAMKRGWDDLVHGRLRGWREVREALRTRRGSGALALGNRPKSIDAQGKGAPDEEIVGDVGYEIWDRFERALIGDFDTEEQALAYLREMVETLNAEGTAQALDRMQLVRITDEGGRTEVVMFGVGLFPLLFAEVRQPATGAGGARPRRGVVRAIEAESEGKYAARGKTLEEHQFVNLLAEEALSHPERMGDMGELLDGVDELLDGLMLPTQVSEDGMREWIGQIFELSAAEVTDLLGPNATTEKVRVVWDLAMLLQEKLRPGRAAVVFRTPPAAFRGRSMLEMVRAGEEAAVLAAVRDRFKQDLEERLAEQPDVGDLSESELDDLSN